MAREKTTQSPALKKLKHKHSDAGAAGLKAVRSVHPEKHGGHFRSTEQIFTPARHRQVFRELYSFFFLQMSLLLVWTAYRFLTSNPIWVDEGVMKAIVFGMPVFWFASRSKFIADEIGLNPNQILPGLYMGLAIGGLYGFVGLFLEVLSGQQVQQGPLYATSIFWWSAFLALLTSWWESLFFFGLPTQFVRSVAPWFSETLLGVFVVFVFLAFHAPLRILLGGVGPQFVVSMSILTLFAVGQFLLYTKTKNMYAIVLSHLLWGLVIEIYAR